MSRIILLIQYETIYEQHRLYWNHLDKIENINIQPLITYIVYLINYSTNIHATKKSLKINSAYKLQRLLTIERDW